ncbi:protein kinase domain-containing protein [Nocardia sp. CA-107356]|uniref:serine/threonine-protein kinase n=1 Tax=Nocardia sp. CA-107356 TaxID=3239972 RepID=UPI003D8F5800
MGETRFGHYRLDRLLGSGGTGQVWLARDTVAGRDVALKVLAATHAADPTYRLRFTREARLAAHVPGPHMVPIHTFGELEGCLYIDMEFIEGTDLAALLRRDGPMSPAKAVAIIGQTAMALDTAHRAGLVHRDVKPSNIMVSSCGFVRLIDFGIAHRIDQPTITAHGNVVGTLAYMAPERFSGVTDTRADQYSLACVLYECLTGERPFGNIDTPRQFHAHLMADPPRAGALNPAVPAALDAAITRAMAKDPRERWSSAGEFACAAYIASAGREASTVEIAAVTSPITRPLSEGWRADVVESWGAGAPAAESPCAHAVESPGATESRCAVESRGGAAVGGRRAGAVGSWGVGMAGLRRVPAAESGGAVASPHSAAVGTWGAGAVESPGAAVVGSRCACVVKLPGATESACAGESQGGAAIGGPCAGVVESWAAGAEGVRGVPATELGYAVESPGAAAVEARDVSVVGTRGVGAVASPNSSAAVAWSAGAVESPGVAGVGSRGVGSVGSPGVVGAQGAGAVASPNSAAVDFQDASAVEASESVQSWGAAAVGSRDIPAVGSRDVGPVDSPGVAAEGARDVAAVGARGAVGSWGAAAAGSRHGSAVGSRGGDALGSWEAGAVGARGTVPWGGTEAGDPGAKRRSGGWAGEPTRGAEALSDRDVVWGVGPGHAAAAMAALVALIGLALWVGRPGGAETASAAPSSARPTPTHPGPALGSLPAESAHAAAPNASIPVAGQPCNPDVDVDAVAADGTPLACRSVGGRMANWIPTQPSGGGPKPDGSPSSSGPAASGNPGNSDPGDDKPSSGKPGHGNRHKPGK